jgi:hypothetical protein
MTGHENLRANRKLSVSTNRSFGLVFAGVFLLIGVWPALRHGETVRLWALGIGVAFASVAVFRDSALAPLNRLWSKLGLALHAIMSPMIMALLFFGAVLPVAVVIRVLGGDPLRLRRSSASSYWISRDPPGPAKNSMKQQF